MNEHPNISNGKSFERLANLLFPLFLITAIGIICYSSSFDAPFTFDDYPSIVENESIRDLRDLKTVWNGSTTRFVGYLSFAGNFHFHALSLFGYHLVNLIIHLSAAFTVYRLVRLLFTTPELRKNPLARHGDNIALAVSLVFVSHPIEIQAVTYVIQRLASMAALFYVLTLFLFLKARIHYEQSDSFPLYLYAASILTTLLAMFTKEIALTLPICILLLEYFFFSPTLRRTLRRLKFIWPFLLTLPLIPVTYLLTRKRLIEHIGLAAETDAISRLDYLLTQFNVIRTYLRLLFWPVGQSIDYDYPISRHFFEPATLLSLLALVCLFITALAVFKKFRLVSFGIIWFFLTLLVESSVIPITDVIFEHRLYLPSVGIFLAATALVFHFLRTRPRTLFFLFALIVSFASMATIKRNITWKEQVLIWNDAVKGAPQKFRAYLNRGVGYDRLNKTELALQDYDRAIGLNDRHPFPYLNKGTTYLNQGKYESAVSEFTLGLSIQPDIASAYLDRGLAYLGWRKYNEAYEDFRKAASLKPRDPFYLNALGVICNKIGRYDLAMLAFTRAIALNDKYATPFLNRGKTKLFTGRFNAALPDFDRASELAPEIPEIYLNRGLAHVGLSHYDKAIGDFTRALTKNPNFLEAYSNRGMAYHRLGLHSRALTDLNRAVELNPDSPRLYRNRGKVLRSLGRNKEARADFQKVEAMEKNPLLNESGMVRSRNPLGKSTPPESQPGHTP